MDKIEQNEALRLQELMLALLKRKGAASRMREDIGRASDASAEPEPVRFELAPSHDEFRARMARISAEWHAQNPGLLSQETGSNESVVPFARPSGQKTSPQPLTGNDEDEFVYRLAAAEAESEAVTGPSALTFRLLLGGRSVTLFANEEAGSEVYARRADLAPEWQGILLGKFRFRFRPTSSHPAFTQIDGLTLRTLRGAVPGDGNGPAEIAAEPFE